MTSSSSSSPEIPAATSSDPQRERERFSYKHATHDEVLEELSSRFIVNLPDEELASLERICFQVEQAHWFYEDFIREENPKLPSLPLKKFSAMLFHACPLLHHWRDDHEEAFNHFMQYKTRVPVCGAIMLNDTMDKCVLVKGWKASSGWGFPKGKINQSEPPHVCAVREVLEETGYDLAGQINPDDVITTTIKEQKISLYIVAGVPEDYPFLTKTRKEISKIEWFRLADLPTWRRNKAAAGKFYLISPFIGPLKAFINDRRPRNVGRGARSKRTSVPTLPTTEEEDEGDLASTTPAPYVDYSDATQESSSQSSSADNCGPQTPSPQHIQAIAHTAPLVAASQSETLDPHMARLLSSLTLSASSNITKDLSEKTPAVVAAPTFAAAAQVMPSTLSPSQDRPGSRQGRPISHLSTRQEQYPDISDGLSNHCVGSPQCTPPAQQDKKPSPRQVPSTMAVSPTSSSVASSITSPLSPRSRGLASRRTSSTADISPYLSRTYEPPSSAKTLKQLALLETIANESEKMTPTLANRGLPPVNLDAPNMGGRYSALPGPPFVAPPIPPNPNDLRVIYSSHPAAGLPISMPPPPNQFSPLPYPPGPIQVRPHTSHSYHHGIGYPIPGDVGSNHNQLLAIMNAPHATPLPNHLPIPSQLQNSYRPHYQPPTMPLAPAVDQMMQPFVTLPPSVQGRPLSRFADPLVQATRSESAAGFGPRGAGMPNPLLSILNAKPAQP